MMSRVIIEECNRFWGFALFPSKFPVLGLLTGFVNKLAYLKGRFVKVSLG